MQTDARRFIDMRLIPQGSPVITRAGTIGQSLGPIRKMGDRAKVLVLLKRMGAGMDGMLALIYRMQHDIYL